MITKLPGSHYQGCGMNRGCGMEDGAFPGFAWPPRVGDYVHVNATGDTARVVGIPDYGAGRRFTIEILPRRGEPSDPDRLVRRTCTLDKLSPESPPEHDPS